jgi:Protein of unknown function (DUF3631)
LGDCDRAIVLAIQRLKSGERVADLFPAEVADELQDLRGRLEDCAAANTDELAAWRRRERITELDVRLQEAWDPLLAIADLAGGAWPGRANSAAKGLAKGAGEVGEQAHGHLLLVALKGLFETHEAFASQALCTALNQSEELPFGEYSNRAGVGRAPWPSCSSPTASGRNRCCWTARTNCDVPYTRQVVTCDDASTRP